MQNKTKLSYKSLLVDFWMKFFQLFLKSQQVPLKSFVRLDNVSLIFSKFFSLRVAHSIFFHEESDDQRGASGHSHLAMYQYISFI